MLRHPGWRTGGAGVCPLFEGADELVVGDGNRLASIPWRPAPAGQRIVRDVVHERRHVLAAILLAVLDLQAERSRAEPGEDHPVLGRRKAPIGGDAGRHVLAVAVGRVRLAVAGGTGKADRAATLRSALDELLVQVAVVPLSRLVAGRMAVDAPLALQH